MKVTWALEVHSDLSNFSKTRWLIPRRLKNTVSNALFTTSVPFFGEGRGASCLRPLCFSSIASPEVVSAAAQTYRAETKISGQTNGVLEEVHTKHLLSVDRG